MNEAAQVDAKLSSARADLEQEANGDDKCGYSTTTTY